MPDRMLPAEILGTETGEPQGGRAPDSGPETDSRRTCAYRCTPATRKRAREREVTSRVPAQSPSLVLSVCVGGIPPHTHTHWHLTQGPSPLPPPLPSFTAPPLSGRRAVPVWHRRTRLRGSCRHAPATTAAERLWRRPPPRASPPLGHPYTAPNTTATTVPFASKSNGSGHAPGAGWLASDSGSVRVRAPESVRVRS